MVAGAFALLVPFAVARELTPDPREYGTHQQLGLGPCPFATITGRLCPTCGMTTAVAWFVRGNFSRAFRANPAGLGVALLSVVSIPWFIGSAVLDTPIGFRSVATPLLGALVIVVVLSLAVWWVRWIVSPQSLIILKSLSASLIGAAGL
jgi:Protein of unknown function (DUF2752)